MTATMARKSPKPGPQPPPDPPQGRSGKSLQLYVPPELAEALDAYIEATRPRPTKTAIVVMLLEDFLKKAGAWPPKQGGE